jgi:hypothetical protein
VASSVVRRHASDFESGVGDFRGDAGAWNMVIASTTVVQLGGP